MRIGRRVGVCVWHADESTWLSGSNGLGLCCCSAMGANNNNTATAADKQQQWPRELEEEEARRRKTETAFWPLENKSNQARFRCISLYNKRVTALSRPSLLCRFSSRLALSLVRSLLCRRTHRTLSGIGSTILHPSPLFTATCRTRMSKVCSLAGKQINYHGR